MAYSHEVSSCGYWPGGSDEGSFYAYAYPAPDGFAAWPVAPEAASYDDALGEFVLPYTAVRHAQDPDALLLAFFQSTYEAAAELAHWDRQPLEVGPDGPAGDMSGGTEVGSSRRSHITRPMMVRHCRSGESGPDPLRIGHFR